MDRFIVGSGRCGSTLLSQMLAGHPQLLSVFEFFNGLDASRRFAEGSISGSEFAELISAEQPFVTAVLRRGYPVAEIVYPYGPAARHRPGQPLPWILVSMLPRLCADPDALFDEVMAFATALPSQPSASHCRQLFDWLTRRMDRQYWVERSGSSIDYLGALHEQFPEARFLHLHRDGCEVALSMREHHAYRLPISLLYGVPADDGPIPQIGPSELRAEPDPRDPVSRILASRPAPDYFGRYWRDQILRGAEARRRIPPDHYSEVGFEELIERPVDVLVRVAEFFGLDRDIAWLERASALVRGSPPGRFEGLGPGEREALLEACRPGYEALGRGR